MKFDFNFWEGIKKKIKFIHLNFLFDLIGGSYLSKEELDFLKKEIGKNNLDYEKIPLLDKIFHLGKLTQKLGVDNVNKLSKEDFNKYIKTANIYSKNNLDKIKKQAYLDILGKQYKIEKDIRQIIQNQNEKYNIGNIVKSIKNSFQEWSDLTASKSYISESIFNEGKIDEILKNSDNNDIFIYKVPLSDACPICKKVYLNFDGSPKIFKLSDLQNNGTNIGIKNSKDWKATVGCVHPNCRCLLQKLNLAKGTTINDYIWNGNIYTLKENLDSNKIERKSKVEIQIGNKKFEI